MTKNSETTKAPAAQVVKGIRRATRKLHSSEEKIRIVCPTTAQSLYYSWSKEFLEAGKKRLAGDTGRRGRIQAK